MSDDGLRDIGCACEIERVLEQLDDGRMNLLARGTRPFRVIERQAHLPYPAGVIEFVEDAAMTRIRSWPAPPGRHTPISSSAPPTVSPRSRSSTTWDAYGHGGHG